VGAGVAAPALKAGCAPQVPRAVAKDIRELLSLFSREKLKIEHPVLDRLFADLHIASESGPFAALLVGWHG
jgi:hypothetical protein